MIPVEVCIDSLQSAIEIAPYINQHSNRIELCSNLIYGGGLTPSIGLFLAISKIIPSNRIMVMIRPRIGSFTYTPSELETMSSDIEIFKSYGVKGVVVGCLTKDGEVDMEAVSVLAEAAKPLEVTFHRAFDLTSNMERSYSSISSILNITRILTSGQAQTALSGISKLQNLISLSHSPPTNPPRPKPKICIASGLNASTLPTFLSSLPGLEEVHLTSSRLFMRSDEDDVSRELLKRGEEFGFGSGEEWRMDFGRLKAFFEVLALGDTSHVKEEDGGE